MTGARTVTRYMPGVGPYYTPAYGEGSPADLKAQFEDVLRGIKEGALTEAGTLIARTPEGRAAIEAEAIRQAKVKAGETARAAFPWLPVLGIAALLMFTRRR